MFYPLFVSFMMSMVMRVNARIVLPMLAAAQMN
jgi:hypothetical protein